jgi:hypothetical protein
MLVEGSSYHITLIIECIWCSGTRMYPLWNATHIWPIWPSWRVEPDTGREVSRAPASCDLSSMLGLSTQLLEERCSLGCWETKTLTFTNNPWFSPTNLLITGHTSSLFPLCCCATSDDADRFVQKQFGGVRTNLSHRPDKTGQVLFLVTAAIACLPLQRPFLVGWIPLHLHLSLWCSFFLDSCSAWCIYCLPG